MTNKNKMVSIEISEELKNALDTSLLDGQTYTELITEMIDELYEYLEDIENTSTARAA